MANTQWSFVVENLRTVVFEFRSRQTAIFETMQIHLNPALIKGFDFIKNIDYSAVIRRIRNIKSNELNSVFHEQSDRCDKNKKTTNLFLFVVSDTFMLKNAYS